MWNDRQTDLSGLSEKEVKLALSIYNAVMDNPSLFNQIIGIATDAIRDRFYRTNRIENEAGSMIASIPKSQRAKILKRINQKAWDLFNIKIIADGLEDLLDPEVKKELSKLTTKGND